MASSDRLRVRLGEPADEDAVVEAMRQMHGLGESGFFDDEGNPFAISDKKLRNVVRAALVGFDSWVGVLQCGPDVGGVVLLELQAPFYSEDKFIAEKTLFVLPGHRRLDAVRALLKFSTDLATALNLPLAVAVNSRERPDAKTKLYARLLGTPSAGGVFLYMPGTR